VIKIVKKKCVAVPLSGAELEVYREPERVRGSAPQHLQVMNGLARAAHAAWQRIIRLQKPEAF